MSIEIKQIKQVMEKYILREWYPSLGKEMEVGSLVHQQGEGLFQHKSGRLFVEGELRDNKFWEGVHGFMILEFTKNAGFYSGVKYPRVSDDLFRAEFMSLGGMSLVAGIEGTFDITKVARGSDKVIFSVGDVVEKPARATDPFFSMNQVITGFKYEEGFIYTIFKQGFQGKLEELNPPKTKIFTTEDGVDKYEGDIWYYVKEGSKEVKKTTTTVYAGKVKNIRSVTRFHDAAAAQQFIDDQGLFKTYEGSVIRSGDSYWCVNTAEHLWSVFPQTAGDRTKLNKTVIAFNTEESARKYVLFHKRSWSISELFGKVDDRTYHTLKEQTKIKLQQELNFTNKTQGL